MKKILLILLTVKSKRIFEFITISTGKDSISLNIKVFINICFVFTF